MCDRESFARLKDQTEENTKQINELAKRDAEQSVQIKDLAKTTEKQGDSLLRLVNRLVAAIIGILVITVLAVIFGALGKDGFNAVTKAAPTTIQEISK
jgi:hypothetical protein